MAMIKYESEEIYSKKDIQHILEANELIKKSMEQLELVKCICDKETLTCIRCEIIDRLLAVEEDLKDTIK